MLKYVKVRKKYVQKNPSTSITQGNEQKLSYLEQLLYKNVFLLKLLRDVYIHTH